MMGGKDKNAKKDKTGSLTALAWQRFRRNKLGMFGITVIGVASLIAILGSLIRPDPTKHANDQILPIALKKPGFTVDILQVRKNREVPTVYFWERLFFGGKPKTLRSTPIKGHRFEGSRMVVEEYRGEGKQAETQMKEYGLANVVYPLEEKGEVEEVRDGVLAFRVLGEGRQTESIASLRKKITRDHLDQKTYWLGTDKFGRDMLSRLMSGTIVSLSVGLIAVLISLFIGITLGSIAGFFRGVLDDLIMWLINVIWSIPTLLLVIALTFALGKGFTQVFIAVGLSMWVEVARIVRGQVLSIREMEFVEAGKALGYPSGRLILKHIIPNVMSPVIVMSAANFAAAILIEAGLSYLGIGAQIPMASWGSIMKTHKDYITNEEMAYLAILPGICIILLVLAFMLVGNGLRDSLDTKTDDGVSSGA